jgi:predicted hydrocarbon binding protein
VRTDGKTSKGLKKIKQQKNLEKEDIKIMENTTKKSTAATELTYTEKELAAIAILKEKAVGAENAKTYTELGISTGTLTSLIKKANDPRPMAEGVERVNVTNMDVEKEVVVTKTLKAYYID